MKGITLWIAVSTLMGCSALAGAARLTYLPLDVSADGISADGNTIVGSKFQGTYYQAIRWTSAGGVQLLGEANENQWTQAYAMSDDGQVIVGQVNDSPGRWTPSTGWQVLPVLTGYYGWTSGVSGNGRVICGVAESPRAHYVEAAQWIGNRLMGLGDLEGGDFYSIANGISHDGLMIVGSGEIYYGYAPFYWTAQTGLVRLSPYGSAVALSWDKSVIVGSSLTNAVRWVNGQEQVLYDTQNGQSSMTVCSADGTVVGGYADYSAQTAMVHAIIWVQGSGVMALRDFATLYGLSFGANIPVSITGISADGRVICGRVDNAEGSQGFVLNLRTSRG
jgi:uncharacterized membrane protein